MLTHLTDALTMFITHLYASAGLAGIVLAMAIESCCIPLPSEIVMPLAGVMIANGTILQRTNLWAALILVALAGALGCLIGSIAAYWIGYAGGRPLMLKYGRYVLISQHDAERADRFFQRWGSATTFFSRLLPVVRTYISLPAGITKMPFVRFCLFTLLGSFPWCLILAFVGYKLGSLQSSLGSVFHSLDIVILVAFVLLVALYIWRHIRNDRKARAALAASEAANVAHASQASQQNAWGQQPQGWGQPQTQSQPWNQVQGQGYQAQQGYQQQPPQQWGQVQSPAQPQSQPQPQPQPWPQGQSQFPPQQQWGQSSSPQQQWPAQNEDDDRTVWRR